MEGIKVACSYLQYGRYYKAGLYDGWYKSMGPNSISKEAYDYIKDNPISNPYLGKLRIKATIMTQIYNKKENNPINAVETTFYLQQISNPDLGERSQAS